MKATSRFLKQREKLPGTKRYCLKEQIVRMAADFSTERVEFSRKRNATCKVVKKTNIQTRILCPVKLSFKSEN